MSDSPGLPRPDAAESETAGRALEPALQSASADRGWGPSALLRPEREIVAFGGRAAERAALRDWCAGLPPHSARVLLGADGVGKTRLARQVAADWGAQAEPWRVVEPGDEPHATAAVRAAGLSRPLLIVDEAESREGLAELLDAALTFPGEARVLLVARSLGDWWDLLIEDSPPDVARLLTEAPPVRLSSPLGPGVADADVAAVAVRYFAAELSRELRWQPEVERSALRLPVLLLHAAALLAVLRCPPGGQGPVRVVLGPRVLDELLEHELRYWQATAAAAGLPGDPELVTHAVTVSTLAGPRCLEEAEALLSRVPRLTGATPDQRVEWAQWLGGLYPPGPNGRLGGLRPDPVAEALVVRQLADDQVLARRFLRALPPAQATHAVTLLARASAREPEATELLRAALHYDLAQLGAAAAHVAQQVPDELPGLLQDALCNAAAAPQTLAAIARGLPRPSLAVAEPELITILRARESLAATGEAGLAEWDDRAARVLHWLDRRDMAPAEPEHAGPPGWRGEPLGPGPPGWGQTGERRFGESQDRPRQAREGQAELASALTNLAVRSSERDRPQDARRAEQQATRIYRELAAAEPGSYLPELAASLANLGVWMAEETGPDDAVPPTREAADLFRELAEADPAPFQPDLATCLANLSLWHTRAGQPAQALAAEQEAAGILRVLALADPEQFQAELAASLTNLGVAYSRAGRAAEAVPAEQEAVALRRELATTDPGGHGADLASSLTNLAITQAELGRLEEAAGAAQAAVTVYRDLAAADPTGYRRHLARALASLGGRHQEAGHPEAAAEALSEAVSLRRGLAAGGPGRNRAGLARTLTRLAAALAELGRQAEADAALAEAETLAARPGAPAEAGTAAADPGTASGASAAPASATAQPVRGHRGGPSDADRSESPAGESDPLVTPDAGRPPAAESAPHAARSAPARRRRPDRTRQGRMPTPGS